MKRFTCLFLFFCVMFSSSTILAVKANDNISDDSNVTTIFGQTLTEEEIQSLNDLVRKNLNLQTFDYEFLSSLTSPNRYILVEGDNCYLVYDRELSDYIEYTTSSNSVYSILSPEATKIYLAPMFYYTLENGILTDITTNEVVPTDKINSLISFEQELKTTYTNNKNILFESNEESQINEITNTDDTVYVPFDYFLLNQQYNIGSNIKGGPFEGSCSYVAIGILLSYYDTVTYDNIIAEGYDVTENRHFPQYNQIAASKYTFSPGIDDNFHEYIINFGRNNVPEATAQYTSSNSFSISMTNTLNLLRDYLSTRGVNDITTHISSSNSNQMTFCQNAISSGNPVLISIYGNSGSLVDLENKNHRVVGYGYNDTGIYANFGWSSEILDTDENGDRINLRHINLNSFLINASCYITLNNLSHSCSNNYIWRSQDCTGTVCPCGIKACNHEIRGYAGYTNVYHKRPCNACGAAVSEAHTFTTSGGFNTCTQCGYSISTSHTHSFSYTPKLGEMHETSCSCLYYAIEPCFGSTNNGQNAVCIKCGQTLG